MRLSRAQKDTKYGRNELWVEISTTFATFVQNVNMDVWFLHLLQALRQLGAIQMLDGAEDDAETSFLRAARLGSTCADQGKVRNSARVDLAAVRQDCVMYAMFGPRQR